MARIVVGMSGGVDSSVAALLLAREGHDVIGVFMNNWEEKDERGVCTAERDFADVRAVCDVIGIPYYSVNFAKEYRERVFEYFLSEYKRGRTPNPDVLCNREIKFDALLDFALKLGAEKLATGHFARVDFKDGAYRLLKSADESKDQTYFLYMLGQRALKHTLFPLSGRTKAEIREIARSAGLPTSEKRDSTGICFIGERDFKRFLQSYLPSQPGDIVTPDGNVVGRHDGLMFYTLGQRRGLGIGGGGNGKRWFVVEKDLKNNRLVVEQGEDAARLFTSCARADGAAWISGTPPASPGERCQVKARFRHRQPLQTVILSIEDESGGLFIEFEEKQRAVTPGQAVVFYDGDVCLGGGTIKQ